MNYQNIPTQELEKFLRDYRMELVKVIEEINKRASQVVRITGSSDKGNYKSEMK